MADPVIITTSKTESEYQQFVVLDGSEYLLKFSWNGRTSRWILGIYDGSDESAILVGRTVVDGTPINSRSRDSRLPSGLIMAYDLSGSGVDPAFTDMHAAGRSPLVFAPFDFIDGS